MSIRLSPASILYVCWETRACWVSHVPSECLWHDIEILVESFLPFQLDDVFSSAFLLHLIEYIIPSFIADDSWKKNTETVLDRMITRGSVVAPLRKLELDRLQTMTMQLTPRETSFLIQSPNSDDHLPRAIDASRIVDDHLDNAHRWDIFDEEEGIGLAPRELLDLAEQLDIDFLINSVSV